MVQWKEILRSHPFRIFVPVAALIVVAAPSLAFFAFEREQATATQLGISTASLFSLLLGLTAGAGGIARDRLHGVREVILARPLSPLAYVAGRWVGAFAAILLSTAVLGGVHLVSLAGRGGAPLGVPAVLAALVVTAALGGLAVAAAMLFSTVLKPGPAFVAALLLLLLSHAVHILPDGPVVAVSRHVLPRLPYLHLGIEAAFGPWSGRVFLLGLAHAAGITALFLVLSAPLAARSARGKT
jgi:ABC-type transport system involved in multi-copper enzyme maturation permease subunit